MAMALIGPQSRTARAMLTWGHFKFRQHMLQKAEAAGTHFHVDRVGGLHQQDSDPSRQRNWGPDRGESNSSFWGLWPVIKCPDMAHFAGSGWNRVDAARRMNV